MKPTVKKRQHMVFTYGMVVTCVVEVEVTVIDDVRVVVTAPPGRVEVERDIVC